MAKFLNRVKVFTSTTGTGTITLGTAFSTLFCTVAEAGGSNGQVFSYVIEDGNDFELGFGTYTSSGTTLSRDTVRLSKIGGTSGTTKINLSGNGVVFLSPAKEDLLSISETQTANTVLAGPVSGGTAAPAFRALVVDDLPTTAIWGKWTISQTFTVAVISAVNTTTDVVTTGVHGLSTGDIIYLASGTSPAGWGSGLRWVNVLSTTTFTIHPSKANAIAGTSRIDLTTAGSGTRNLNKVIVTLGGSTGIDTTVGDWGLLLNQTTLKGTVTLTTPMSSANSWVAMFNSARGDGLVAVATTDLTYTTTTAGFTVRDTGFTEFDWVSTTSIFPLPLGLIVAGA
jgi:hypothetical protein